MSNNSSKFDLIYELYGVKPEVSVQVNPPANVTVIASDIVVKDEGVPVMANVNKFDFVGAGVTAIKRADGTVEVNIPIASNPGVERKANNSGVLIPKHTLVSERPDGTIAKLDLSTPLDEKFFGITQEDILDGQDGRVRFEGEELGGLANYSFPQETTLYASAVPGLLMDKTGVADLPAGTLVQVIGKATGSGLSLLLQPRIIIRKS